MSELLQNYLAMPEMRKALLAKFQVAHEENWQKQGTPETVVTGMLDLVKDTPELLYVVLFNHEFLEELIFARGVPRERVMFMADCESEAYLSRRVYGVKTFELPQSCRDPKQATELLVPKIEKAFYQGGSMPKTNNLVVFGNPPYQEQTEQQKDRGGKGAKQAKPLYHKFVEAVVSLNPRYHSFIIPSRWMLGGMGLNKFREWMLGGAPNNKEDKAKHISKIVDFKSKVFEADIAGGVCYYLWDREHDGMCEYDGKIRKLDEFDVFIRDNIGVDILHKVLYHHKGKWVGDIVSVQTPYGIKTNEEASVQGVPCWFTQGQGKLFIAPHLVKDPRGDLPRWKVLAPKTPIAGQTDFTQALGFFSERNLILAAPGECCTQTYLVVNSFNTEEEAKNFKKYMLTRFFRFMLLLRVVSQDIMSEKYSWVPDLGSYTTAPTDEQLFKQFGLSAWEIEYINRRIK